MDHASKQRLKEIQRRTISLTTSSESFLLYLHNLQQTSGLSPELQSVVAATSEFLSLMTEALRVSQLDMNRLNWTEDSTPFRNWRAHWHTAYENFVTQTNIGFLADDLEF